MVVTASNLIPLHDYVVIKVEEEKEQVKGSIIIPDTAKEESLQGVIIAVGPGRREKGEHVPLDVKVGDKVMFKKYFNAGSRLKLDDGEVLVVREDELIAKIGGAAKAAGGKK